ncbi:PucR family transcriptional regulator [uncultured Jatrophihabitans sp.]|uniref:PucR family transcriptional regulator n=1 Tax=uncultured Jatrophihabitans sp. TaxID=1610747 RepID=UPI0035CC9B50
MTSTDSAPADSATAASASTDSVPADVLAEVAADAARDSGGVPVELLGDFLATLVAAVAVGTPIPAATLRAYRGVGDRAARRGVALRALLDLYLSAAWRLWRRLPEVADARSPEGVVVAGEVMLHAADDVVAALTEGYQLARRSLVRTEEAGRREFIDDLLTGAADVVGLLHRASGFGLELAGPHAVAVVAAERPFDDGSPLIGRLERAVSGSKGDAHALLASKEGRLVVVFAAPDQAAVAHVADRLRATLDKASAGRGSVGAFQLALGRPGAGAAGVATSYGEACDALELAGRLGLSGAVVDARDLLVYRLLARDRASLADIVESSLGALRQARGGSGPLVDTLGAWFARGGNTAAAARELHLSVRAVTYRLDRVRALTGLDPDAPDDRFALHVAVLGARLLGWPTAHSEV